MQLARKRIAGAPKYLGVSPQAVYLWVERKQIPHLRVTNGTQDCLAKSLRGAKVPYFRIYDLRSTYATRLSAGGVADEWVTQMLRQSDAQVFKKYSQMKLQMKREALEKLNRRANEMAPVAADVLAAPLCTVAVQ
jgi:integrase